MSGKDIVKENPDLHRALRRAAIQITRIADNAAHVALHGVSADRALRVQKLHNIIQPKRLLYTNGFIYEGPFVQRDKLMVRVPIFVNNKQQRRSRYPITYGPLRNALIAHMRDLFMDFYGQSRNATALRYLLDPLVPAQNKLYRTMALSTFLTNHYPGFNYTVPPHVFRGFTESCGVTKFEVVICKDAKDLVTAYATPSAGCISSNGTTGTGGNRQLQRDYAKEYDCFPQSYLFHIPDVDVFYVKNLSSNRPCGRGLIFHKEKKIGYMRGFHNQAARIEVEAYAKSIGYSVMPTLHGFREYLPNVFKMPLYKRKDGVYMIPWGVVDTYSGSYGVEIYLPKVGYKDHCLVRVRGSNTPLSPDERTNYVRVGEGSDGYGNYNGYVTLPDTALVKDLFKNTEEQVFANRVT